MSLRHCARILVFAGIAGVCFFRLGHTPLYETDEGFAATRADSFFRHGTWRLSYDDVADDQPQFRKPPLLYWAVAVLFKLLGRNLWAVRLPTALAAFGCAVLLYAITRRYFPEGCALLAAALPCTVPFYVLHIRTAMLELPLLFLLLLGVHAQAFLPARWYRPVLAGLAGGGGLLLKALGGAGAVVVPVIFGLLRHRFRRRALVDALCALTLALALPALYLLCVPAEYRLTMFQRLGTGEVAERVRFWRTAGERVQVCLRPLLAALRWHMPAAVVGLLVLVLRRRAPREGTGSDSPAPERCGPRWEWLVLAGLVTLPVCRVVSAMVYPFPRYLLPVFPFVLTLSAWFVWTACRSREDAVWLVIFAGLAWPLETGWLRWLPVGAALFAAAVLWWPRGAAAPAPARPVLLRALLLLAIVLPSLQSAAAWSLHPPARLQPRPELQPLAMRAAELAPPGQKLVVENGLKCHTILFYGRRAIDPFDQWLLTHVVPGETRYAIFLHEPPADIPHLRAEVLETSGSWKLVALTALPASPPWRGILLCAERDRDACGRTLELLDVKATAFERGFVLNDIPGGGAVRSPPSGTRICSSTAGDLTGRFGPGKPPHALQSAEALTFEFPEDLWLAGVNIVPAHKGQRAEGLCLEASVDGTDWQAVRTVAGPVKLNLMVNDGRLKKTALQAVRLRCAARRVRALRLVRTAPEPLVVSRVEVIEAGPVEG